MVDLSCIPKQRHTRDGKCYMLAASFVMANKDWTLVHATLYPRNGKFENKPFPHAFVERGDKVFDPVFNHFYVKDYYYVLHRVTDEKKYTLDEACKMMLKTKNYGAWD